MELLENIVLDSQHNQKKMLGDIRYIKSGTSKPVILFVHGFKGFKDWGHFNLIADWFAQNGFVYCKFNLSHNGTTLSSPSYHSDLETFGRNNMSIELDDLGVIMNFIEGKEFPVPSPDVDTRKLFLIGHSRGGGLSILKSYEDNRIKAICTWAAIGDVANLWPQQVIDRWKNEGVLYIENTRTGQQMPLYYQLVEDYEDNRERLDIPKAASSIKQPWLIVHGTEDETVHISTAYELKNRNNKAELFVLEGATHTLGGGHPYNSTKLLKPTKMILKKTAEFFKDQLNPL